MKKLIFSLVLSLVVLSVSGQKRPDIPANIQRTVPKEKPKEMPRERPKEAPKETQPVEQPINQGFTTGAPDVHVYDEGGKPVRVYREDRNVNYGNDPRLTGRDLIGRLPLPVYRVQDAGVVVVTIIVNEEGNVIKATPGAKGSTTSNKTLLDAAEKAALQAKFSRKPDILEQRGTITYIFKIQGE